jgi:SAM-dependent methyltransferase
MQRRQFLAALAGAGMAGLAQASETGRLLLTQRGPDVIFVPTPNEVVDKMYELAQVTAKDVVYDLGCGDGRIVIGAAQRFGARGVGIDIDPQRIAEATANVKDAGVGDRVRLIQGDLFEADISEATVVMLYLLTRLNVKLRPKLLKELKPGTRIVSHAFDMGDWAPERKVAVGGTTVFLWRVPARA